MTLKKLKSKNLIKRFGLRSSSVTFSFLFFIYLLSYETIRVPSGKGPLSFESSILFSRPVVSLIADAAKEPEATERSQQL